MPINKEAEMEESRTEIYHNPKPWYKKVKLLQGFQYDIVGDPKAGKFYGVGCKTSWYQWNCPDE